jgi:hypothetical protein
MRQILAKCQHQEYGILPRFFKEKQFSPHPRRTGPGGPAELPPVHIRANTIDKVASSWIKMRDREAV